MSFIENTFIFILCNKSVLKLNYILAHARHNRNPSLFLFLTLINRLTFGNSFKNYQKLAARFFVPILWNHHITRPSHKHLFLIRFLYLEIKNLFTWYFTRNLLLMNVNKVMTESTKKKIAAPQHPTCLRKTRQSYRHLSTTAVITFYFRNQIQGSQVCDMKEKCDSNRA